MEDEKIVNIDDEVADLNETAETAVLSETEDAAEQNDDFVPVKMPSKFTLFVKRAFDICSSGAAILVLCPFFLFFTPVVAVAMKGNPFFVQKRPGKNGKIFKLIKYRTMTAAKDKDGNLLPDEIRLTKFGNFLRSTSIDELPELMNIFVGNMSVVGPRPQLIKDAAFMDETVKQRHSVRPGLTGLAQISGRNNQTWEERFCYDLEYIKRIGLFYDLAIIIKTVEKVFKRDDVSADGMATAEDYGDYLLRTERITKEEYDAKLGKTKPIIDDKFSVLMSVYYKEKPEYLRRSLESILESTVMPDQIVVVRDGNLTAELDTLLDNFAVSYPEIFTVSGYEINRGLGLALAYGLDECRNELVARMDSDDICVADRFDKQLAAFRGDPELSIVGGNMKEFVDVVENVVGERNVPSNYDDIVLFMKRRCPFNHITVMFKKTEVEKAGNYQDWHFNEDYYLWVRMYLQGCRFLNLQDVFAYARVGKDMFARRGGSEYFKSECGLFKFMRKNGIIGLWGYIEAVTIRFVVQILMPNGVRQWFFKTFARN